MHERRHDAGHTRVIREDADVAQLPVGVQRQIIEKLVEAGRLAPVEPGTLPFLRCHAEAVFQTEAGRTIRRVTIESRTGDDSAPKTHSSRFVIYSTGVVDLRL